MLSPCSSAFSTSATLATALSAVAPSLLRASSRLAPAWVMAMKACLYSLMAAGLQAGIELHQQVVDRPRALFASAHFVVQARQAQVLGQLIEAGNEAQF